MGTIKNAIYKVDNGTDFDEIHFKTNSGQVMCGNTTLTSQLTHIENKSSCHIEDFRLNGESDTEAFIRASKSGLSVILDNKTYEINETIDMMFNTEFIGSNRTIISCNSDLNTLFNLGHSCKLKNIKIIYNSTIKDVLSINTKHILKSISDVSIYDFVADRALYNIQLENIVIYRKNESYEGDTAIQIVATGEGLCGWGIKINNIELHGCFNYGIRYITLQDKEDGAYPWITDVKIDDVKMVLTKVGFLFDSFNETLEGKEPSPPSLCKITNVSLQYHSKAERFAIIRSGLHIYFNDCMPWDFNKSKNKPYLITTDNVSDLKISNLYGYGIERINSDSSVTKDKLGSNEGVLEGSFTTLPTPQNDDGIFTFRELQLLEPGSYRISMDDKWSTALGLPTGTFSYGGCLYVFGGYRGLKTIMVVPSNIHWSKYTSKYNKVIYMMNLSLELKTTTSQNTKNFLNTSVTKAYWYELKDVNDGSIPNGSTENRPVLVFSQRGYQYYDTTLRKLIYWDGTNWKTIKDDTTV